MGEIAAAKAVAAGLILLLATAAWLLWHELRYRVLRRRRAEALAAELDAVETESAPRTPVQRWQGVDDSLRVPFQEPGWPEGSQ